MKRIKIPIANPLKKGTSGTLEIDDDLARLLAEMMLAGHDINLVGTAARRDDGTAMLFSVWFRGVSAVEAPLSLTTVVDVTMTGAGAPL